jgi:choline dehydrogenase-like flavoprotein
MGQGFGCSGLMARLDRRQSMHVATHPSQRAFHQGCQVFGIRGLYVCGGSVFPTAGYANPALAIVALALRLTDQLRARPAERAISRADVTFSPV